jgi:hypothetical protein
MAKFDAYYKWFGIRPDEQPANYYRLLGIQAFEQDPDVISNAADQRMSHLRSLQNGPYAYESQRILNEVSRARVTLLDVEEKLEYDVVLRKKIAATAKANAVGADVSLPPLGDDLLDELPDGSHLDFDSAHLPGAAGGSSGGAAGGYSVYRPKKSAGVLRAASLLIGMCLGLSVVYVLLAQFAGVDPFALFPAVEVVDRGENVGSTAGGNKAGTDSANKKQPASIESPESEDDAPIPESTPVRRTGNARNTNSGTTTPKPKPRDEERPPVDPTPAANGNPFVSVPKFVALAAVSERSPQPLVEFPGAASMRTQVSLVSDAANLDKGKKLELVADNAQQMPRWRIELAGVDASKAVKRESLAEVWIDGNTLFFAWDQVQDRAGDAAQVQNCVIVLRSGKNEAALRLREPVTAPVYLLDLATAASLLEIPVEAPPKADSLILEMGPPDTLTWNAEFQGQRNSVRFATPTREKIVIDLDVIAETERPQLVIEPHASPKGLSFRAAMRIVNREEETPVSMAQVAETRKKYTAFKIKVDREWNALHNKAAMLDTQATEMGRELRLSPANRSRIEKELARINAQIFQTKAAIEKINVSKAEYEGVLDFLPAVETLIEDLHQKAKFPYRVYAKAGNVEIEIARSGEESP